jgi:hypothetical protein
MSELSTRAAIVEWAALAASSEAAAAVAASAAATLDAWARRAVS